VSSLIKHVNHQSALPPVPRAPRDVLVPTGRLIPCYGIWEPVRLGRGVGTYDTPKGVPYELGPSREIDGRALDGCMNYLHGDFAAPTIEFDGDAPRNDGRPTTWRLVWRDDRYGDARIPAEESHYVFVQPVSGEVLFTYGGKGRPLP
jgi:Immunity protein 72